MESTKDCKVLFTTLIQRMWKTGEEVNQIDKPLYLIDPLIAYTIKLAKTKRFLDLKENKFCFLESAIITRSFALI